MPELTTPAQTIEPSLGMVVTFDDPWSNPENPSRVVVTCLARTSEDRVDDDLFCWKDILRTEWSLAQINAGRPEIERAA